MNAARQFGARLRPLLERFDALAVRERGLLFAAAVAVVYFTWQHLVMDPLLARGQHATQRLGDARRHLSSLDQMDASLSDDPLIAAASRNRALRMRLATLNDELHSAAQGYVAPERMAGLLREMLANQRGLRLLSLTNLPVESLAHPANAATHADAATADAATAGAATETEALADDDRGPFLHPVEMVVEGSYADVVAYLRTLEGMSWRIYWQRLELQAGDYPVNRVRIVIGALSLSRDWISV